MKNFSNDLFDIFAASSVSVSAWTLVAISCERYYAICHPLSSRRWQTLSHAYKLIALIWFLSFLLMSPIAALSRLIPTSQGKSSLYYYIIPAIYIFFMNVFESSDTNIKSNYLVLRADVVLLMIT